MLSNNQNLKLKIKTLISLLDKTEISPEKNAKIQTFLDNLENFIKFSEVIEDKATDNKLLISKEERPNGLKVIRQFTKDAEKLIVVDPYFFDGNKDDVENFIEEVKLTTRVQKLDYLTIVYNSSKETKVYSKALENLVKKECNCTLRLKPTDAIHDRIWIKDREKALLVGTSLNGLGKSKICFILPLPEEDLDELSEFLTTEKLI